VDFLFGLKRVFLTRYEAFSRSWRTPPPTPSLTLVSPLYRVGSFRVHNCPVAFPQLTKSLSGLPLIIVPGAGSREIFVPSSSGWPFSFIFLPPYSLFGELVMGSARPPTQIHDHPQGHTAAQEQKSTGLLPPASLDLVTHLPPTPSASGSPHPLDLEANSAPPLTPPTTTLP